MCSPDGTFVVDAFKDVVDGGAGCRTSWVLTKGLADSVGPQITVIRVSNHSIISSCCYAIHWSHEMIYDWLLGWLCGTRLYVMECHINRLHLFLVAVVSLTKVLKMVP